MSEPSVPPRVSVPAWYPSWARELAELYYSGTTCLFVLHGNVHDLVHCPQEAGDEPFCTLADFLATQIFGNWDIVASYDLAKGLRPVPGPGQNRRLQEMMTYLSGRLGTQATWPRDPDKVLAVVDHLVARNLLATDGEPTRQMSFLFPYAQYLMPAGDLMMLAGGKAARLVRLMSWAQDPYIKRVNMAFCLIAENLAEVNERLVQSPHVAAIEVPLPDEATRRTFIDLSLDSSSRTAGDRPAAGDRRKASAGDGKTPPAAGDAATGAGEPAGDAKLAGIDREGLTQISNGLNLISLNVVLKQPGQLTPQAFGELKKTMIERQCRGLVTFVEPRHTLDLVVGHEAAKQRLRQDGQWIEQGRLEAAPMGYLLCGPVGTGKTFLAECFAGSIGIPCVVLRNFRSKYVGETEGNLEHVLNVLRSLGPVVVIIDEADAALGNRQSGGDSGTSSRVFSMIASQMGNTNYRGRIIWMLLTSRPDLLPIDLKRQGRAEVHIPLFYPQTAEELREMLSVMARKNRAQLADDAIVALDPEQAYSGADIESIVLDARRHAMADGRVEISRDDLQRALSNFIPSAQGLEKERQEMTAVLECTDRSFLTDYWRRRVDLPDGRSQIQRRCQEIRAILSDD